MDDYEEERHHEQRPLTDSPMHINRIEVEEFPDKGMWTMDVGNTGLTIIVYDGQPNEAQQHFIPEDNDLLVPGKEIQYSLMYALGIQSLIDWWKENKDKPTGSFPLFDTLYGTTNGRMHEFRKKLLGSCYQDMGGERDQCFYKLSLIDLNQDIQAQERLQKLAQKCKQRNYTVSY